MARGKSRPEKRSPVIYLQCDISSKAHKDKLIAWLEQPLDFVGIIEKLTDSGLKVSCSYDTYNDCFQAAITQVAETEGDQTVVLVGRGGDQTQALQALFFKYYIMLEEKMEDLDSKNGRGHTDWG